ncbi:MAG TPA: FAD-binding oxidoreductase [Luteibacter sp.]|jgi:gamma-glutamylputrescine oxidase|nr:FAD-binding oxidoreductase [Luteibacter sp.]
MVASYYQAKARTVQAYAPLEGLREANVVVIGGGFAGLNAALGLAQRGIGDVVLLENERIGFGASGRNGGFVFAGYSLGEQSLLDRLGPERARALYRRTVDAVDIIRSRIDEFTIACDAVDEGVIWANWFRDPAVLRRRQQLLAERYGVDWQWLPAEELGQLIRSRRYRDGLYERNALHLDPLAYARGLARAASERGVRVHEHSGVHGLTREGSGWRVRTNHGEVRARQVVLACGGYLAGLDRRIDKAILPIATYVMVTEPLGTRLDDCLTTRAAIYDTRFAFDYYRPLPDTRLLWGGRISVRDRSARSVQRLLRRDMQRVFPQLGEVRIDYAWSGMMSYARHEMPQVGHAGEGLWYAQAFGGHGLAPTCAAGEALAEAIAEGRSGLEAFADFGLVSSHRPFGYVAAQGTYWWHEWNDWLKSRLEGS